jgi:hypothetical protein
MANNGRSSYEHYREAVHARLSVYTLALDNPDDRVVAIIARAELPRYVRYWVDLLTSTKRQPAESARPVPDGGAQSPRLAAPGSGRTRA